MDGTVETVHKIFVVSTGEYVKMTEEECRATKIKLNKSGYISWIVTVN